MQQGYDLREMLDYINPAVLDYQEWVNVGMALKKEGYTCNVWDSWSRADARYKNGECFRKWTSFERTDGDAVSGGTIVEYAKRGGFVPMSKAEDKALDWDSPIQRDDLQVVDHGWMEETAFEEPSDKDWSPVTDLITYLQTLFQSTENVGYVVDVYENDDRLSPKKGNWDRTAGQLIEALKKCKGDIGAVIGDCNPKAGAWIRFNPLDGEGIKNSNVTDYRYALVESDVVDLSKQEAIMRELELPIACMVYSGKKSVHAIVKVDAPDYAEYRRRVEFLYKVCEKNGLKVDTQNKNPSRLSRMPGVVRDGHKQFLMAHNIGKSTWEEWQEWIEGVNDDLPEFENLGDCWDNMEPLTECLIEGVLRKGHKMLIAGPSKAGKSFALIELAIAIAEGTSWLVPEFKCAQGKVLYVNLEVDNKSSKRRFRDVYERLGMPDAPHRWNIEIWNLRGKSLPMDKLAPKLIRRCEKKPVDAVIIDPIYKVITGDENAADQMSNFCNQFDKVCNSLNAAVIYCHHHSKGAQGGKKSIDRASGSGVFARDPDAMLDLAQLEPKKETVAFLEGKAMLKGIERALDEFLPGWQQRSDVPDRDDQLSPSAFKMFADEALKANVSARVKMETYIQEEQKVARQMTAWRIEGTLREFAPFEPLNLWFKYPIHVSEYTDSLKDIEVEAVDPFGRKRLREKQEEKGAETLEAYLSALDDLFDGDVEEVDYKDLAEYMAKSEQTVKKDFTGENRKGKFYPRHSVGIREAGYVYKRGKILKKDKQEDKGN